MKLKKLFAAVICIILSLCVFAGGCGLFDGSSDDKDKTDNGKPSEGQTEEEEDVDFGHNVEYTITFNAGDHGTLSQTTDTTGVNQKLASLPEPKTDAGYTFLGWYTAKTGGTKVTTDYVFTNSITLYAHYSKKEVKPEPAKEYTVTLNAGTLGTLPAGTATELTTVNQKLASLPVPAVGENCTFIGWYTAKTGGDKVRDTYKYTKDITLHAHYRQAQINTADWKLGANDYLTADGRDVKNQDGDTLYLRGVNAGGLFVTEEWMTGVNGKDYKTVTKKFIERFGEEKTKDLWSEYRADWWTDVDFENCVDMGMNVIRLPFTYMNVDFDAIIDYDYAGSYDFTDIEEFVGKAAEYGLYTILDLHGAYGSQNGQDHSGEEKGSKEEVDFYSNEKMQTLTVNLWSALSEHFKDNPAVAGYDILNEPGEKAAVINETHWAVFDKIYDAIRANGDNHIIMFESCWDAWNLPKPSDYGWENCMYSFHHYVGSEPSVEEHLGNWEWKLSSAEEMNFNVPLQMGEFTAYDSTEKWEQTLALLKEHNWHYTSWTYKTCLQSAWGIYNVSGDNKANPSSDSYNDIINKFKNLRTANGAKYTFGNGKTLSGLFKYSLTGAVEPSVMITKVGLKEEGGKAYAVFSGTCTLNEENELLSYVIDGEISGRKKLTLEVVSYDKNNGTFEIKADLSVFNQNGRYYLHAGFDSVPPNLPESTAQIDSANSTVTAGGKTYSLGGEWGTRQIVVS